MTQSESRRHCAECGALLPREGLRGACPRCLLLRGFEPLASEEPDDPRATVHLVLPEEPDGVALLSQMGDYQLLREIGRGGMGVIYEARQLSLDRVVALKLIRTGKFASLEGVTRFKLEAAATAGLRHPGIVAVHEVGEHEGRHFYSMDLVPGRSLASALREGPLPPRIAAQCVQKVAEAIHFAHEHGVVHRDLKPSNILLDAEGEPHVADFGLAKLLQSDSELTLTGAVLGSPNYMPPEQARGHHTAVSPRSDVYALGAILYECLTGRPPFTAATALETMKLVIEQDPVPPRVLNSALSPDLETICLKCLAKDAASRYASAEHMAGDLGRFLRSEPIHARPSTLGDRAWKWSRRHPSHAALVGLALAVPAIIIAVLLVMDAKVTVQRNLARQQGQKAEVEAQHAQDARAETRQNLYAADMLLAQHALDDGNLGLARRLVMAYAPSVAVPALAGQGLGTSSAPKPAKAGTTNQAELRGFEWRYAWKRCQGEQLHTLYDHSNGVHSVVFSRDGKLLASGDDAGFVKVWNVATCQPSITLPASQAPIRHLSFSADGHALATGDEAGVVKVWNLATLKVLWKHQGRNVEGFQLSPAGTLIGVTRGTLTKPAANVLAQVVDWTTGNEVFSLPEADFEAFSHDGKLAFITYSHPARTELWNLETGRVSEVISNFSAYLFPSPNGRYLAGLSLLGRTQIDLIDLVENRPLMSLKLASGIALSLAFSPDSALLACATSDQIVRLWDLSDQREIAPLLGHVDQITGVAFSPDGKLLATSSADKTVMLWPVMGQKDAEKISKAFPPCVLSPDGLKLASLHHSEGATRILIWDLATHKSTLLPQPNEQLWPEFFSDDNHRFFARPVIPLGGVLSLLQWPLDALTNQPVATPLVLKSAEPITASAIALSGRRYALSQRGAKRVFLWDAITGKSLGELPNQPSQSHGPPWSFSPDGRFLASSDETGQITLVEVAVPERVKRIRWPSTSVRHLAFSPDASTLAVACTDHSIRLLDTASSREVGILSGHQQTVGVVAFSPDGRTLASSAGGGTIKLWCLAARREVATLIRGAPEFHFVAFTPDGNTLLAADWIGRLHSWQAPALTEIDRKP